MPPPTGSTGCWRAPSATCRAAACRRSIRDGRVKVAGAVVRESSTRVQPGAEIVLEIPAAAPAEPRGEPIALAVVYEDEDIIVIDKPAGLVVHPAAGHDSGTLVNALIAHCGESLSGIGGVKRPGIVHRLDKDTSGLLVVAKTDRAHRGLAAQFADHGRTGALERAYHRAGLGRARPDARRRRRRDRPQPANREKMAVVADDRGRHARTHYAVEAVFGPAKEPVASFAALQAGDRPHAPDPRPYGEDRPPAARRRELRGRVQDQGGPAFARGARGASRPRPPGSARRRARVRAPGERRKPAFRERTAARPAAADRQPCGRRSRGDARRSVARRRRAQTKAGARR